MRYFGAKDKPFEEQVKTMVAIQSRIFSITYVLTIIIVFPATWHLISTRFWYGGERASSELWAILNVVPEWVGVIPFLILFGFFVRIGSMNLVPFLTLEAEATIRGEKFKKW